MRKLKSTHQFVSFVVLVMLFITSSSAWASKAEYEKKREWTKTFSASKGDQLLVDNQYGNIVIAYGNKKEVVFRVVVEARSGNEKRAQALLDHVRIDFKKEGNRIAGKTTIESTNSNSSGNESFSINYYVEMPKELAMELNQKYGNVSLPATNQSDCQLNVRYGNISGGDFSTSLAVDLRYGNMDLGNVSNGQLKLSYSQRVELQQCTSLTVDSRYSNMELEDVRSLTYEGKYGNFTIASMQEGTILMRYGNGKIGSVSSQLIVNELSYSTLHVQALSLDFKLVRASARYGNLTILLPPTAAFTVDANDMKYGQCSVKGFDQLKRLSASESNDFDSNREKEDKSRIHLQINGSNNRLIEFDGNNYSNLKVQAK